MKKIFPLIVLSLLLFAGCDNTPPPEPENTKFVIHVEPEEIISTDCGLISDSENLDECGICLNLSSYSEDALKTWAGNNAPDLLSCYSDGECYLKKGRKTFVGFNKDFLSLIKYNDTYQASIDKWLNENFSEKEITLLNLCENNRYTSYENAIPSV